MAIDLASTASLLAVRAPAPMRRYTDTVLGFAAEVPAGWEIGAHLEAIDALARSWSGVEFRSELQVYGHQAFEPYSIGVQTAPSLGGKLTKTVELSLCPLIPVYRDQVQMRCCLTIGGEEAMELADHPPTRWGSRQIVALHEG